MTQEASNSADQTAQQPARSSPAPPVASPAKRAEASVASPSPAKRARTGSPNSATATLTMFTDTSGSLSHSSQQEHPHYSTDRTLVLPPLGLDSGFAAHQSAGCLQRALRASPALPAGSTILVVASSAHAPHFTGIPGVSVARGGGAGATYETARGGALVCEIGPRVGSARGTATSRALLQAGKLDAGTRAALAARASDGTPVRPPRALVVRVPVDAPLARENGARFLIHSAVPNIDPAKPGKTLGRADGLRMLELAYCACIEAWTRLCAGEDVEEVAPPGASEKNAFDILMSASQHSPSSAAAAAARRPPVAAAAGPRRGGGSWRDALLPYCERPEAHGASVVFFDDTLVVVRDKFPKARTHLLVMPRARLARADLRRHHVHLLDAMHARADALAVELACDVPLRVGFHAVPSMTQLHLHVISADMDGVGLKTKHHYNSFVTDFLIPLENMRAMLEKEGHVSMDTRKFEQMLARPLKCEACGTDEFTSVSKLKEHLASDDHFKVLRGLVTHLTTSQ